MILRVREISLDELVLSLGVGGALPLHGCPVVREQFRTLFFILIYEVDHMLLGLDEQKFLLLCSLPELVRFFIMLFIHFSVF